jgi:hypothetical protein
VEENEIVKEGDNEKLRNNQMNKKRNKEGKKLR